MRFRTLARVVFAMGVARSVGAETLCAGTEDCLRLLANRQHETRVLSASFRQTKFVSLLAEPIVTTGQMSLRAPDRMVWRIDEPAQVVRIEKGELHLPGHDESAKQASRAWAESLGHVTRMLSGDLAALGEHFEIQATASGPGIQAALLPRHAAMRETIEKIELDFAAPELTLAAVRIREPLGDRLEIVFSDVHRNDARAEAAASAP